MSKTLNNVVTHDRLFDNKLSVENSSVKKKGNRTLKRLSVTLVILMFLAPSVVVVSDMFGESGSGAANPVFGEGTAQRPFVITNESELAGIGQNPNAYYILGDDITISNFKTVQTFSGVLYGNGKTIKSLKTAMFTNNRGTIQDLIVEAADVSITSSNASTVYAGSIAEYNYGTITRCDVYNSTISATLTTTSNSATTIAGGIAAYNSGSITYCYVSPGTAVRATITHSTTDSNSAYGTAASGGIAGQSTGTVQGCSSGAVTSSDIVYNYKGAVIIVGGVEPSEYAVSGGVVGSRTGGTVSDCYGTGGLATASIIVNGTNMWGTGSSYNRCTHSTGAICGAGSSTSSTTVTSNVPKWNYANGDGLLTVTSKPTKTDYSAGEAIDISGMAVVLRGSSSNIPLSLSSVSVYDLTAKSGAQWLYVKYLDKITVLSLKGDAGQAVSFSTESWLLWAAMCIVVLAAIGGMIWFKRSP